MISVVKFDPRRVECTKPFEGDVMVLKACQAIVDQMKTSKDVEFFAQQSLHDHGIEVPLPYILVAPTSGSTDSPHIFRDIGTKREFCKAPKCILKVTGRLPRQFGNWYRIWEAAVAITAMCVRKGKGGYWEGLGKWTVSLRIPVKFPVLIFWQRGNRKPYCGGGQSPTCFCIAGMMSRMIPASLKPWSLGLGRPWRPSSRASVHDVLVSIMATTRGTLTYQTLKRCRARISRSRLLLLGRSEDMKFSYTSAGTNYGHYYQFMGIDSIIPVHSSSSIR